MENVWRDMCVLETMVGGPTLRCDWIEVDYGTRSACLRGTEPGRVMGQEDFREEP